MTNTYVLNSDSLVESIQVTYTNGLFEELKVPVKHPLTYTQHRKLLSVIPYTEDLLEYIMEGLKIRLSKPTNDYIKIKLFCQKYMEFKKGEKYTVMPKDRGRVKLVPMDAEKLDAYFKSQAFEIVGKAGTGKHSICNYVDNYNLLMQEVAFAGKTKHPDYWSEPYENKLKTQQELSEYWAHLRSLGLEPKKDRIGKTIDWIKKEN